MKIENEFTVPAPIDEAWEVLTDLEGIAPCLPGAQLTGVDGEVYQGKVKIKVGPVVSEFAGTARFAEKDDDAHRAVIDAKGRDSRSAGNAAALITSVTQFVGRVRGLDLDKAPGMAETIDWVGALSALGATELVRPDAVRTLGAIAKSPDDRDAILALLERP